MTRLVGPSKPSPSGSAASACANARSKLAAETSAWSCSFRIVELRAAITSSNAAMRASHPGCIVEKNEGKFLGCEALKNSRNTRKYSKHLSPRAELYDAPVGSRSGRQRFRVAAPRKEFMSARVLSRRFERRLFATLGAAVFALSLAVPAACTSYLATSRPARSGDFAQRFDHRRRSRRAAAARLHFARRTLATARHFGRGRSALPRDADRLRGRPVL